ncbi:DUF1642 domain-containing protein [Enterococcus malodoratus]|jgi:hypothetical protein|uniref:DUF1642 domain-containing protein n=1 Tax=Enterococcus malodoratus TaxID=71451 RepID=UPI00205A1786|nr:MAG TPA: Protein of unknown function (DUF1642) [Caudoviricetes sp.]
MGKQELIEKWENKTSAPSCKISASSIRPSEYEMYNVGYGVARVEIIEDLKRLDEPQKVKVPAFVAEWIEWSQNRKWALSNVVDASNIKYFEDHNEPTGLTSWFVKKGHDEILARAWLDGYEVEKEPKWKIINDQNYCLTSIEAGYGNSLHWAFDSTKKRPILFDNEETAMYTAYITGGIVEKVEV